MSYFFTSVCGHPLRRRCWEDPKTLSCQKQVTFDHKDCGHSGRKKCYVTFVLCQNPCEKMMDCGKHPCREICGSNHPHTKCQADDKFTFPNCGHDAIKKCCESISSQKCKSDVQATLERCRHDVTKKCHEKESDVVCTHFCREQNDCRKHDCTRKCGEVHSHAVCDKPVPYRFPGKIVFLLFLLF